jgi:TonB family protein
VAAVNTGPAQPPIYEATYPGLALPAIVRQDVPQWPRGLGSPPNRDALLAIVINEKGHVESARVTRVVHRTYDQLLLNAVSAWSYVPAQLAGKPVKFRKVIKLTFR